MASEEKPLEIQDQFLQKLGYQDVSRRSRLGVDPELRHLIAFHVGEYRLFPLSPIGLLTSAILLSILLSLRLLSGRIVCWIKYGKSRRYFESISFIISLSVVFWMVNNRMCNCETIVKYTNSILLL